MPFELSHHLTSAHLIVQAADAALNPPESYFYVQDGLIISCGVLYALCYFFYMTRTCRDRTCAGPIEYLGLTMAYELFYAFATTTSAFELGCFLMWILMDVSFATVALISAYPLHRRMLVVTRIVGMILAGVSFLWWLCQWFPDEREQVTAYWTGLILQFPISAGSVVLLLQRRSTKGHSLEIWVTRILGCVTAYGLFIWRYLNIPANWSYVVHPWSIGILVLTMAAEILYPFVYIWVYLQEGKLDSQSREAKAEMK